MFYTANSLRQHTEIHISACQDLYPARRHPIVGIKFRAPHVLKLIYVAQFGKAPKGSRVPLASAPLSVWQFDRVRARPKKSRGNLFVPPFPAKDAFPFYGRLCNNVGAFPVSAPSDPSLPPRETFNVMEWTLSLSFSSRLLVCTAIISLLRSRSQHITQSVFQF